MNVKATLVMPVRIHSCVYSRLVAFDHWTLACTIPQATTLKLSCAMLFLHGSFACSCHNVIDSPGITQAKCGESVSSFVRDTEMESSELRDLSCHWPNWCFVLFSTFVSYWRLASELRAAPTRTRKNFGVVLLQGRVFGLILQFVLFAHCQIKYC